MIENKCLRCEHSWKPRKQTISPRCPKCGSSTWYIQEKSKEKKLRKCNLCGKNFKPMTDRQWEINKLLHNKISVRHHREYLRKVFEPHVSDFEGKLVWLQPVKDSGNDYFITCFDKLTEADKSKLEDRFQARSGETPNNGKYGIIMMSPVYANPYSEKRIKFQYWVE